MIDHEKKTILNTLVKPSISIPEESAAIHGIDDVMVQAAPTFLQIYQDLKELLSNQVVVIYNAAFDVGILEYCCQLHGLPKLMLDSWCLMRSYAAFYGDYSDYWESYTWQPLNGGHRALGDCYAAYDRLTEMASEQSLINPTFPEYCTLQVLVECDRVNQYLKGGLHPGDYKCELPYRYYFGNPDNNIPPELYVFCDAHPDAKAYGWAKATWSKDS